MSTRFLSPPSAATPPHPTPSSSAHPDEFVLSKREPTPPPPPEDVSPHYSGRQRATPMVRQCLPEFLSIRQWLGGVIVHALLVFGDALGNLDLRLNRPSQLIGIARQTQFAVAKAHLQTHKLSARGPCHVGGSLALTRGAWPSELDILFLLPRDGSNSSCAYLGQIMAPH